MAPELRAQAHGDAEESPRPRRRRLRPGSGLLLGGALVCAAAAGTMWVTGVGTAARVAAAGTAATATPAPATTPSAAGAVAAASHTAGTLATEPAGPRDLLISADGTLDTTVTIYGDCSGQTELTHSQAAIDTCVSGRTYFVGHNAGVFTPLLDLGAGDIITYYDDKGAAHRLRIVEVRDNWLRANGVPPLANANVVAQFQTCETAYPDGSHDRILDAVAD